MFDSTFRILTDRPVAVPAFPFGIWVVYRILLERRSQVGRLAGYLTVTGTVPLFLALFLAEFTDHRFWQRTADTVIRFESAVIAVGLEFVDAAFAAWLRLFLLVASGSWGAIRGVVSASAPVVAGHTFLMAVFGFEFFAGAALIYALYRSSRGDAVNGWLQSVGVILLLSGLFSTLVRFETARSNEAAFASGLVAATLGLTLGVSSIVLLVRPNFSDGSGLSNRQDPGQWTDESDAGGRVRDFAEAAVSRLMRLFSDRER